MKDTIDDIQFLAGSPVRIRLLEELFEHERLEKRALKERIDVSRTTVQRNLDAVAARGWVAGDNRQYWITQAGKPVTEQYLKLLDTTHAAKRLQPFLEWLPSNEFELGVHSLATAELTVSDENNPYAPVNRHIDLMKSSDRFRGLLPAIGLQPMMVARDCVIEQGQQQEVILDHTLVDTILRDGQYQELLEELLQSDRADILVTERSIPFYLGLTDDVVQIGVSDDTGTPRCIVESDAPDVQAWVERTYNAYKPSAEPFPSPGTTLPTPKERSDKALRHAGDEPR